MSRGRVSRAGFLFNSGIRLLKWASGLSLTLLAALASPAFGLQLTQLNQIVLEDSEESYDRRIYSYDIAYDSLGRIHIVYALPVPGQNATQIIYTYGSMADLRDQTHRQVLATDGKLGSISTFVRIDSRDDAHVCYIKHQNDPQTSLYYRKITAGVPGNEIKVAAGGWHTKMALNELDQPIFVRDFVLRPIILIPTGPASWTSAEIPLNDPGANYYLTADFVYDRQARIAHLTYSDSSYLSPRCAYGVTTCAGSYFGRFQYASSPNLHDWTSSTIFDTPRLWEYEFWHALNIDAAGEPHAAMYNMNPAYLGYPPNGQVLRGSKAGETWITSNVGGDGCSPSQLNAGGGLGIAIDGEGGFWGFWDNSPVQACNICGPQPRGCTVLAYSPDGIAWQEVMMLNPFSAEGNNRVATFGNRLADLVLGDHTNARLYLAEYLLPYWWAGATDLGGGWKYLPWLGYFNTSFDPWIFHQEHGFLYPFPDSTGSGVYFYDSGMGRFWWTTDSLYPNVYRFGAGDGGWLWYLRDSVAPRQFFNFTAGSWETAP